MSDDKRDAIIKIGFLFSILFWGFNIAFRRVEYISPSATFGLFEYIPFVFIIPLSFTLAYALNSIKKGGKTVYFLFIIFFFILWSTPYLMEEQVRDWDAYWHGFASYRITEGITGAGNSFIYSSGFPGAFIFFASLFQIIGGENFLSYLKFVPIITILVTALGMVSFFYALENYIPNKRIQLRYTMFLSVILCPFFSFHLSPQALGLMLMFFIFALMTKILTKPEASSFKLYMVLLLFLAVLTISHPTTFLFVFLFLLMLPFTKIINVRTESRSKILVYFIMLAIVLAISTSMLFILADNTDLIVLKNIKNGLSNFFVALMNPGYFVNYVKYYTVTTNISSIIQKVFFALTIPIMFLFYLKKERPLIMKTYFLATALFLVVMVGMSGGFFLERPFILFAIPLAYGILNIDLRELRKKLFKRKISERRMVISKRAIIAIFLVLMLFLPTFYWRECSVMFTDEEIEAMNYSWSVSGAGEGIILSESFYPFFFLIGENNTYALQDIKPFPDKVILVYDKSNWAGYNLRGGDINRLSSLDNRGDIVFSSENVVVYYLK